MEKSTKIPVHSKDARARKVNLGFAFLLSCVLSCGVKSRAQSPVQTVLQSLGNAPLRFVTSTDAKHQNDDYLVLKPDETRRLALGSGHLIRFWCTSLEPNQTDVTLQNGAQSFVVWQHGRTPIAGAEVYQKALTWYPTEATPEFRRTFSNAMLVVTNRAKTESKFFYQATLAQNSAKPLALAPGKPVKLGGTQVTIAAGKSGAPIRVDLRGKSGIVSEIRVVAAPVNLETLSQLYLRVDRLKISSRTANGVSSMKDGASTPVYASVAALAGQFYALQKTENAMTSFDGETLILRWPMPFDGARDDLQISLENHGAREVQATLGVQIGETKSALPWLFCAVEGSARTRKGQPISMLKARGSGALVGFNMAIAPTKDSTRRTFSYLEGNEKISADGKTYEGTGTEDFFNSAWYFPAQSFNRAFHGLTFKSESPPRVSMYRLMIPDAVSFQKNIHFSFEVGKSNNADDLEYHWVSFWYQKAPLDFGVEDALQTEVQNPNAPLPVAPAEKVRPESGVLWAALGGASIVVIAWILRRKTRR